MEDGLKQRIYENILRFLENYRYIKSTAEATIPSSYVMAKNMGHESVLTSSCIATTTLLSALTLTGWIFLLRSGGYL